MVPIGGNVLVILAGAAFVTVRFLSRPKDPQQSSEDEEDQTESAEGSVVKPVNLEWHSVTCGLQDKSGKLVKCFLRSISGEAKAGRLLAIMGPSGAGKTTLLNVLAGQLSSSNRLKLSGLLYFNGNPCSFLPHKAAYVRQEDLFFSQLTVRETLSLAAELQLPNFMTSTERSKYVDGLLSRLGLTSCADTRVGDAKVRGISGGEKKRLSIACELIASPSIIFADEPTTGLDAFQAEKVMETLRKLAQDGHTVICSIHQPRGSIYSKFDDLVLLAGGSLVYAGPAQDDALTYFNELGYNCPEHVNPAEYFADLISIDYSSSDAEAVTRLRVTNLIASYASRSGVKIDRISIQLDKGSLVLSKLPPTSYYRQNRNWWKQFCLLLGRAWSQATRDAPTNKVRSIMSVASAIIFGSVFWRMKLLQTSIQDRMGLLQLAAINTAMAALTKTVNVFPKERAIVDRERAKGSYSLAPYLAAKLIAEMPISAVFPLMFGALVYPMAGLHPALPRLGKFAGIITVESFTASAMGLTVGAIAPTTEAAMALGPSLMTVFMVFGGYYINSENTPVIFKWIPRVSLIRWAFQALCINEFKGLTFDCKSSFDLQNGEQVIERLGFSEGSIKKAITEECRILLFWYCMTYIIMRSNKPRFKSISSPVVDTKLASEN